MIYQVQFLHELKIRGILETVMKTSHLKHQEKYFKKDLSYYKEYEKSLNAWRYSYLARIKNDLLDKKYRTKVLLDVGTGSGYVAIELAKGGMKVIASDIVPSTLKNIDNYRKGHKLTALKTLLCPAEKFPLKSGSVDYIIANSVLEHVEDEEGAIKEWKRILRPKGRVFITVPLKFRYIWPFFWPINFIHDRNLGHLHRYSVKDLQQKFQLKVRRIYYTGHLLKVLWVIISRLSMGGLRKSSDLDYLFEDIDKKFENIPYGASNLIVIFEKN